MCAWEGVPNRYFSGGEKSLPPKVGKQLDRPFSGLRETPALRLSHLDWLSAEMGLTPLVVLTVSYNNFLSCVAFLPFRLVCFVILDPIGGYQSGPKYFAPNCPIGSGVASVI